jgi:hypothetical protein
MLLGTIGESLGEVWTLVKTSVIFYVRLPRIVSVESAMEAKQKEKKLDPCLIKKQETQDPALIP